MKRFRNAWWTVAALGLMLAGAFSSVADGQSRNERQVRELLRALTAQVDDFQYGLDYELKNNSAGRVSTADLNSSLRRLQDQVRSFDDNFIARRENREDVNGVIAAAADVDGALASVRLNRRLQTDWADVKKTITDLAGSYGVTARFDRRISNATRGTSYDPIASPSASGLTGTYSIDLSRSENVSDIVSRSGVQSGDRQDLESKLDAPERIALGIRGNQVTLASSKSAPVTVVADGREKVEQANGRTIRLRATLRGGELIVSSLGGDTDYTITFTSIDGGNGLKVTRRITTEYLSETVFAESVYRKTDAIAGLGIDPNAAPAAGNTGGYSSTDPADTSGNLPGPSIGPGRTGEFIVPNGMVLTASLENVIDTKVSQNNDRFKLIVQSPIEFRGAVIEGHISGVGRSGRVSGSSNVTFNFEYITMRDGRRYDFAGTLQGVKDQYGKVIRVDSEGTARSDSQTRETTKRGGIGAGAGAIIGAIAGGLKGAAIGAIIGGGAGAGSVIAMGREDIKLMQGSTLTIQSSSPIRGQESVSEND